MNKAQKDFFNLVKNNRISILLKPAYMGRSFFREQFLEQQEKRKQQPQFLNVGLSSSGQG